MAVMLERLAKQDRKLRPSDRDAAGPGHASCPGAWLGRPGQAGQRALGGQPGQPLGLVHAGRPHHPAVQPAAGDAGLGGRLRAGARARAPAGARARAGLLGRWSSASRAPSGPGATSRACRRPPGSTSPTTEPTQPRPAPAARRTRRPRSATAAPGSSPAGTSTEPRHVVGLVADHGLGAGRRHHGVPHVEVLAAGPERGRQRVPVQVDRAVADAAAARRCRTPRWPRAAPRRPACRRRGSQCPPSWPQKPPLRCSVSSTRSPVGSSTRALAVRWAGTQPRSIPSSWVLRCSRYAERSCSCGSSGAAQRGQGRARASACEAAAVTAGRARAAPRCRRGRTGPAAPSRRWRSRPGRRGRRPSAAGRGAPRPRRGRPGPRSASTARHSAAASRSRRGRSSSPTSEANVSSAGPPLARRRRTVSRSAAAAGSLLLAAASTTSSTQPSTSASAVSSRASAAFCSGVSSGSNSPPVSASLQGLRVGRVDAADRLLEARGVDA